MDHRASGRFRRRRAPRWLCGEAEALDRRVRIVNESKHDIVAFYGTNVSVRDWQDSLLGENRLAGRGVGRPQFRG